MPREDVCVAGIFSAVRSLAQIIYAWASSVAGVSRAEIVVFWIVACPSQAFTNARAAPASSKCVAIACFRIS